MSAQNPFGLATVTPYLVIEGVEAIISFCEDILGGTVRGGVRYREDGSVQHVEISIGDSVVMMGEPVDDLESMPSTLYVYVDDCDASYSAAINAGAESVMEPANQRHGDRYGGVKDSAGNIWWLVTHIG